MLNSTTIRLGSNSQNVTFNTPSSGIMQKCHPRSRFIRFHSNSELAKTVMGYNKLMPHFTIKNKGDAYERDPATGEYSRETTHFITVLQIMVFGQYELIVEIVKNDDLIPETIEYPQTPVDQPKY